MPHLDPVDFRAVEYVGSYDPNLMCPICHCPFVSPVQLICKHVFCQRCVDQAMRYQDEGSGRCPACRATINSTSITPLPKILNQILDNVLVRCPLRSQGCREEMPRARLQNHLEKYCLFYEVRCPYEECCAKVQRKDAEEGRCLHSFVECEDCKSSMMRKDLQHHCASKCNVRKAVCPYCENQTPVCDLDAHIEGCPYLILPCTAASYGCDFKDSRKELDDHLKGCSLAKLVPFLKSQNDRLEAHESALKDLRQRNSVLEASFANIRDTLCDSANLSDVSTSSASTLDPGFSDSTTHHLLSLHESLRDEINRVSDALREADARLSLSFMNESLRMKEDFAHSNAAIGGMRMQLHWLMNARLQNQHGATVVKGQTSRDGSHSSAEVHLVEKRNLPVRRLSDVARQETKL